MSKSTAMKYLDTAMTALQPLGLVQSKQEHLPIQSLIDKITDFGPDEAMAIAMVLAQQSVFNEAVVQEISDMSISNRYEEIVAKFTSIREDTSKRLTYIETGKVGLPQRIGVKFADFRRGTIPQRFKRIKQVFLEVSRDLADQIDRENRIINAYQDYRFATKDAGSQAYKLLEAAEAQLATARQQVDECQANLDAVGDDLTDRTRNDLELKREEAIRNFKTLDSKYQVAKSLAEQLRVAYHASDFVFAQINQFTQVKQAIYDSGVAFFSTNEIVFTGNAAAFTTLQGMGEATLTLNAMKDELNKSLQQQAKIGGKLMEEGLRAAHAPSIQVETMRALVDSVLNHEQSQHALKQELRKISTSATKEISVIAEEGKQRYVKLLNSI